MEPTPQERRKAGQLWRGLAARALQTERLLNKAQRPSDPKKMGEKIIREQAKMKEKIKQAKMGEKINKQVWRLAETHRRLLSELSSQKVAAPPWDLLSAGITDRHLLGRPIQLVMGFADLAAGGSDGQMLARAAKQAENIKWHSQALSKLFKGTVGKGPVDVAAVLKHVKEHTLSELISGQNRIQVSFELKQSRARIDPHLLYWCVKETVGNAAKAVSIAGKQEKTIKVRSFTREDGSPVIEVADNGTGINPEHLEGERSIWTNRSGFAESGKIAGSGKILPKIRDVIEQHGGKLELETKLGKGTTFRFVLPPVRGERRRP
jgi:signal transduction histidine kinase